MGQSATLLKNTFIYTVGNVGSKLLSFILLPLFSFFLTKGELGVYDLMITSISLFVPLVSMQISDATYRWLLSARQHSNYISFTLSNALAILIVSICIFSSALYLFSGVFKLEYFQYFQCILITSCLLPFVQQTVRGLGKNKLYAVAGVLNAGLAFVLNCTFLFIFTNRVHGLFLALLLSNLITIIFLIVNVKLLQHLKVRYLSVKMCRRMINYSWPLILNTVSWWLINASDRYIILYYLSVDSNGLYAVASRFPSLIVLLNSIFMLAWQDHVISNDEKQGSEFFNRVFMNFVIFELSAVIILISISKPLVQAFLSENFLESWRYMPLLYLGAAFSAFAGYLGAEYLKRKQTKLLFTSSLIAGVINIMISVLLMPSIGLFAPALGTFVSFVTMYFLRVSKSSLRGPQNWLYILSFVALLVTGLTLVDNNLVTLATIIISIALFIKLNSKLLNKVLNTLVTTLKR